MQPDWSGTRVGILGAGAVGGYLGVRLSAAGLPVVMVGREALLRSRHALEAIDARGDRVTPSASLVVTDEPQALADADLCLVTVKSNDTDSAGQLLSSVLAPDTLVVALQDGLKNVARLKRYLSNPVVAGAFDFQVRRPSPGVFLQALGGSMTLEQTEIGADQVSLLVHAFNRAGLTTKIRKDIADPLAARLLASLHNGPCGALGLDLGELLLDHDARWCLGQCLLEGFEVLRLSGMRPPRSAGLAAWILRHPFGLQKLGMDTVAAHLLSMDPNADVSVLQDLRRGRATEISQLNGEIVRRGRRLGIAAPCNTLVSHVVCAHERALKDGLRVRWLTPRALRRRMRMHQGAQLWR